MKGGSYRCRPWFCLRKVWNYVQHICRSFYGELAALRASVRGSPGQLGRSIDTCEGDSGCFRHYEYSRGKPELCVEFECGGNDVGTNEHDSGAACHGVYEAPVTLLLHSGATAVGIVSTKTYGVVALRGACEGIGGEHNGAGICGIIEPYDDSSEKKG